MKSVIKGLFLYEASYSNGVITVKFPKITGKLVEIRVERKGN